MSLNQKDELLLRIYSIDYLLKCRVDEVTENDLKLSPISGKVDMFQVSDPVVLVFYEEKHMQMLPADVTFIDKTAGQVTFSRPKADINEERRIFERYPVSLIISARRKFSSKRLHFVAKNISMYGMCLISQEEVDAEESIDIDLITEKTMFYFSGKIIWRRNLTGCFEYGLQLTHYDISTQKAMEDFLGNQKSTYEKMISKAR